MELKRWPSFLAMTFMFSFRAFSFAQELGDKPDIPSLDEPVAGGAIVAEEAREEDDKSVSGEPSPKVNLYDLLKLQDGSLSPLPAEPPKFMIGVSLAEVPASLRAHITLEDKQGIMVGRVLPDSPAAKAGLQQYDIIIGSGDKKLSHPKELQSLVDAAGEKPVTVTVQRRGELKTIEITPLKREAFQFSEGLSQLPGFTVGSSPRTVSGVPQGLLLSSGSSHRTVSGVQQGLVLPDGRVIVLTNSDSQDEVPPAAVDAGQIGSLTHSIQALTQQMERLQQAIDRLEKKSQAPEDHSPNKATKDAP